MTDWVCKVKRMIDVKFYKFLRNVEFCCCTLRNILAYKIRVKSLNLRDFFG